MANGLTLSGIVGSYIRWSVAGASGVAMGVALTIKLRIANLAETCAGAAGATV